MARLDDKMRELDAFVDAGVAHYKREGCLDPGYAEFTVVRKMKEISRQICHNIKRRRYHIPEGGQGESSILVDHYTSIGALFSMLQGTADGNRESLRLYDSVHLNDPAEGQILAEYFERHHDWVKLVPKHPSYAYIASFVGPTADTNKGLSDENLVLWLVYGRECEGCSLKLSIPRSQLWKVSYSSEEASRTGKALLPVLASVAPLAEVGQDVRVSLAKGFFESLEGIQYLYKSDDYRFENECRYLMGDSNVNREDICYEVSDKSPVIVRHYWEHEQLAVEKILGSGSSITIGSRVPDSDDLERAIRNLICRINLRLKKSKQPVIDPKIYFSKTQYRKI